ncbi:MAG: hypothetical protein WD046_05455 [Paracoccaceae bacterium]
MKNLVAIAAVTLAAGGAYAQSMPMGSIPQGFEFSGDIDYSYAFNSTGNESFGLAEFRLGYRHEFNNDMSVTLGVRSLSIFGGIGDETEFDFYGFIGFRNFQVGYGAIDNAAARFDWRFAEFENTYFDLYAIPAPIGRYIEFRFLTDVIRVDAQFGNFDMSASYSDDAELFSVAGETQFGNTRVLAAAEFFEGSSFSAWTVAANHTMGAFEIGGTIGLLQDGGSSEFITTLAAAYHINDALSVKGIYSTFDSFDIWELSATYAINEMFSIGASVGGSNDFGGEEIFGINAKARF